MNAHLKLLLAFTLLVPATVRSQITPPENCDIWSVPLKSDTPYRIDIGINWEYGCFGYMETKFVERSIGNTTHFQVVDTTDVNHYTEFVALPDTTYYFRIKYPTTEGTVYSNTLAVRTPHPDDFITEPDTIPKGYYPIKDPAFAQFLADYDPALIHQDSLLVLSQAATQRALYLNNFAQEFAIKNLDGLQHFLSLTDLSFYYVQVEKVPDLSGLLNLDKLNMTIQHSQLDFNEILLLTKIARPAINFTYFQFDKEAFYFAKGSEAVLSAHIADHHPDNTYTWIKRRNVAYVKDFPHFDAHLVSPGSPADDTVAVTADPVLRIPDFNREDIGYYSVIVKNSQVHPTTYLEYYPALVTLGPKPTWYPDRIFYPATDSLKDQHTIRTMTDNNELFLGDIKNGDVLGVFYTNEQGLLQLSSAIPYIGETRSIGMELLPSMAKGSQKNGFDPGEKMHFKLWDPVEQQEYPLTVKYADSLQIANSLEDPADIENFFTVYNVKDDGKFYPSSGKSYEEKPNLSLSFIYDLQKMEDPWEAVVGGSDNHLVVIPANVQVDIQGQPLALGDYVGFFFEGEDGKLVCSDYAEWTGENLALNPWVNGGDPKNGFDPGEHLQLKIWKAALKEAFTAELVVYEEAVPFEGSGKFVPNAISKVISIKTNAHCTAQSIHLYAGWNLVSTNVIPRDTDMAVMWAGIEPVIIKNASGNIEYAPQNGITGNGWDYKQGYQVYVQADTVLEVCGAAVPGNTSINIPLTTYPYLLPYWGSSSQAVQAYLQPVERDFNYAQQVAFDPQSGKFEADNYIPAHIIDPPIDQIGNMQPGLAYKLQMNATATFTYSPPSETNSRFLKSQRIARQDAASVHYMELPNANEQNAVVVIPHQALASSGLQAGDEVAVWSSGGVMLGSDLYQEASMALTIWQHPDIKKGEPITFSVWRKETQKEVAATADFIRGSGHYVSNTLQMVSDFRIEEELPYQHRAYPNPAKEQVMFSFPEDVRNETVLLEIYDGSGNSVLTIQKKITAFQDNKVVIDVKALPAGLYFYKMSYGSKSIQKRLIINK